MPMKSYIIAFVATLLMGLTGCSQDSSGDCDGNSDFCLGQLPRLSTQPSEGLLNIVTGELNIGDLLTRTLRVINTGTGLLELKSVHLEYSPPDGTTEATPAFALIEPEITFPFIIHPFNGEVSPQGLDLKIRFTQPADALMREATLVLTSNDGVYTANRDGVTRIPITTAPAFSAILLTPNPLDFGLVARAQRATRTLTIANISLQPRTISALTLVGDTRFGATIQSREYSGTTLSNRVTLNPPLELAPQEATTIDLWFETESVTPATAELLLYSDDPVGGANGHSATLIANREGPCIRVAPSELVFGGKRVGSQNQLVFSIQSCGTQPLEITSLDWLDGLPDEFTLDFGDDAAPSLDAPWRIPVNDMRDLSVTYVPDEVSPRDSANQVIPDLATIRILSNAVASPFDLKVSGAGVDVECPMPVIRLPQGEEVIPQTVIQLDGSQSYAAYGAITNYNWEVAPPDGVQRPIFLPNVVSPTPLVQLDAVGLYTFTLSVRDSFGLASGRPECPNATVSVLVQPDEALHVELTWVTPGDNDESDQGEGKGSDLDLHFAHPFATGPDLDGDNQPDPWFDRIWDVFWFNPLPQWGSTDVSVGDDPSLDRDDSDGGGPENLHLSEPESGVPYRIGVHYWNDHGFGPVTATVKVFHYADVVYEASLANMRRLDMWCVATVEFPGPVVQRCAENEQPEKVTPNYINPFFQPF